MSVSCTGDEAKNQRNGQTVEHRVVEDEQRT